VSEPLGVAEIEELIGAYALDAVEPDERVAIEAHLADCPRCRAELADHLEAASYLSYTGAPAPDALWGRISAAMEEPPPALRLAVVQPRAGRFRPSRPVAWTLAAAAAVILVVMSVALVRQHGQIDDLHHQPVAAAMARSARQAMADPSGQHLTLRSPSGATMTARAVISPSGTGYLLAGDLPKLDSDRTYQLWGVSGGKVISLGLLGPSPQVSTFSAHGGVKGLAITDEVAGGVVVTRQTPVLAT
jgi:anti-sigma factor RsiW